MMEFPLDRAMLKALEVPRHMQFDDEPGVYFLYRGPQVVYVGQSTAVQHRLYRHHVYHIDRAEFLPVKPVHLRVVEFAFIVLLDPPENKNRSCPMAFAASAPRVLHQYGINVKKFPALHPYIFGPLVDTL